MEAAKMVLIAKAMGRMKSIVGEAPAMRWVVGREQPWAEWAAAECFARWGEDEQMGLRVRLVGDEDAGC